MVDHAPSGISEREKLKLRSNDQAALLWCCADRVSATRVISSLHECEEGKDNDEDSRNRLLCSTGVYYVPRAG